MKKIILVFFVFSIVLIFALSLKGDHSVQAANDMNPPPWYPIVPYPVIQQTDGNLLINGDLDQLGFYWRPPNHYVAGMWFEWWADHRNIPEFIDGGHRYHNVCYPVPADGICTNNHSQGYIKWGGVFKAGMYQVVNGTEPCTLYEFSMYNRNDAKNYHPRVGMEPTGWYNTQKGGSGPDNCPPDGASKCPDPNLDLNKDFPDTMVWSPELVHTASWEKGSVTAEAVGNRISVWTYTAPDSGTSLSSYWDYGSLTQVPFPDNRLPAPESEIPSGFIQNLTIAALDRLIITWDTPEPASTQVWYTIIAEGASGDPTNYTEATPLDMTFKTEHRVVIEALDVGDTVYFVALSRRPNGDFCTTATSGPQSVTIADHIVPDDWTPSGDIQNLTATPFLDALYVTWQTPYPATTQLWYSIAHAPTPPTPTTTIMISYPIYLPFISIQRDITPTYQFMTPWDLNMTQEHKVVIRNIKDKDSIYFVAISSHLVDDKAIVTKVSEQMVVWQMKVPNMTYIYLPITQRMQ